MLTIIAVVGLVVAAIALLFVLIWLLSLDRRVTQIEGNFKHMPTHDDLRRIETQLSGLNGEVSTLGERSERSNRMLEIIHEHLLDGD